MKFVGVVGAVLLAAGFASEDRAVGTSALPDDPQGIIHELDTITGMNDGHELVARRVELHVPVVDRIHDGAFWVGWADNRVLVVLASGHRLDAEANGELVAISGTIDRVPKAEQRYSDRPIYIRAETAAPHAQAGTAP